MSNRRGDVIPGMLVSEAMGGERIEERKLYGLATEILVPWLQALSLVGAFVMLLGSFWLLAAPIAVFLGVATTQMDLVLIATFVMIAIWGSGVMFDIASKNGKRWKHRRWWYRLARALSSFVLVLFVLNLVWALLGEWQKQDTWRILGGLALIPSAGWIYYRFSWELYNPNYPKGPWIETLGRILEHLWGEPGSPKTVVRPYPVRTGGSLVGPQVPADEEDEEEEEAPAAVADPIFRDCVWFLALAEKLGGMGRSGMIIHPHRIAPSGKKLTRGHYDDIAEELARWGIVDVGGGGVAHRLRMETDEAIALLENVIAIAEGE